MVSNDRTSVSSKSIKILKKYQNSSLTGMVAILIEEYSPDSYES